MTTNHVDQLTEWWEGAEKGVIEEGDTVIHRADGETTVYVATRATCRQHPNARILARAPKPKPAWHDAVAVIAHTARFSERRPFALTHTEDVLDPYNTEWITRDDLLDPAPLIEAKVTDEMILAALNASTGLDMLTVTSFKRHEIEDMRLALTAALGLETE